MEIGNTLFYHLNVHYTNLPCLSALVSTSRRQDFIALSTLNTTQYLKKKENKKILWILERLDYYL